jgi:hypothetical protein
VSEHDRRREKEKRRREKVRYEVSETGVGSATRRNHY